MRDNDNSFYSNAHPGVLDKSRGKRIAAQMRAVLIDYLCKPTKNLTVLDIGCSSGEATRILAQDFRSTIGIDIDSQAIQKAKKIRIPHTTFKIQSFLNNSLNDESFDIIICHQVYYYMEDHEKFACELQRVMKKGGICLFFARNTYSLSRNNDSCPNYYLSYWGLKALFRNFSIRSYTSDIIHSPRKFHFSNLAPYEWALCYIPIPVLRVLEPIMPNFVWVLQK